MKQKYIFFRNDDVRGTLDKTLIELTELCVTNNVPISLTIEPANVTLEVVDWLLDMKSKYPELFEIVQHGYSHKLNYQKMIGKKLKKGEFGGDRTFQEQFKEIKQGKDMMDKYFGDKWFPLFTFPYGGRNDETLQAVRDSGFKAVNGSMGISSLHKLVYYIGRFMTKEMLFGRKISYHCLNKKKFNLFQIDTSFSLEKKFIDEETQADIYSLDELKEKTQKYLNQTSVLGIVTHHRYHNTKDKLKVIENYIKWLKEQPNIQFVNQECIYQSFKNRMI